jgi:hypothetical protein
MESNKWRDLGAGEKTKLGLSIFLIICSVVLGFISFIILNEVPGSVIGINGVWCSTALALLGITAYVNSEIVKMRTKVDGKIDELDDAERNFKHRNKNIEEDNI